MKNLLLLFSLCPVFILGQVNIDFENGLTGDWEQYPAGRWEVSDLNPLNGNYSLRQSFDNTESSCDAISFNFGEIKTDSLLRWKFLLHYGYKPSGSNNWAVYLLSQNPCSSFRHDNEALILGVNRTGNDDSLRLYTQKGSELSTEAVIPVNWETDIGNDPVEITVSRNIQGLIEILVVDMEKGTRFSSREIAGISLATHAEYFGLDYCYTSSKDMLLALDDLEFHASFYKDSIPPELTGLEFISNSSIELVFNEEIRIDGQPELLKVDRTFPDSIYTGGNRLGAVFSESFINEREYSYTFSGITDRKLNESHGEGKFIFYYPDYKDIIFTEIMADPDPPVYLPEEEYVEILNRSDHEIDLEDFLFIAGSRKHILPPSILAPGDYCFFGLREGSMYGEEEGFLALLTSGTELNNSGMLLQLYNSAGTLIDALEYSSSWNKDEMKSEGGWSIERVDTGNLCGDYGNWLFSTGANGGTPGMANSVSGVLPDYSSPFAEHLVWNGGTSWTIEMNESLNPKRTIEIHESLSFLTGFEILPPLFDRIEFQTGSEALLPLSVELPVVTEDCNFNTNRPGDSLYIGVPGKCTFLDVMISEIMFDPDDGKPEFVEIRNCTSKLLSLYDLCLEVRNEDSLNAKSNFISDRQILFFPGDILVLNPDNYSMQSGYHLPEQFSLVEIKSWNTLPDQSGRIMLKDRSGKLLDEVHYSADQHFPMLSFTNGVSLERISFNREPGIMASWHSASSLSDFSSPGFQNSQELKEVSGNSRFNSLKEKFTPDNDGMDDLAVFSYSFGKEDFVGTGYVFDPSGRIVRTLFRNELLGTYGQFSWDGADNSGSICHSGIYLVYLEVFRPGGTRKSYRKSIVLIRR